MAEPEEPHTFGANAKEPASPDSSDADLELAARKQHAVREHEQTRMRGRFEPSRIRCTSLNPPGIGVPMLSTVTGTGLAIRVSSLPLPLVGPVKKLIGSSVPFPDGSSAERQPPTRTQRRPR